MTDGPQQTTEDALAAISDLIAGRRFADAEAAAAARLRETPADVEAMRLRAIALLQLGRIDEARGGLTAALALAPQSIEILCNLGSVELACGNAQAALSALERAHSLAPAHPAVLVGLGNARRAAGDLAGAREAYAGATRASPSHAGAWLNLAAAELALGAKSEAERDVRHALMLAPGHPEALLLLGHVLASERRYAEAESAYAAGARSAPQDARFPYQCGLMAEQQRHFADAAGLHARALALDPSLDHALGQLVFLKRQLCDWRDLDALSARLRQRVAEGAPGIVPFGFLSEPSGPAEQLQCARTFAAAIDARAAPLRARRPFDHAIAGPGPLRVGFVSNGFGNHPTGLLIVAMMEALGDEAIDVHAFATTGDDGSPIRRRLRAAASVWHDVADLPPLPLAERIHAAGIEIVVDLHDGGGEVNDALALRPAPVQVSWLSYPGTTGAPWIDYFVADRVVLPATLRAHFSERIAYLPRCYQPSDPGRIVAAPPPREACGLPAEGTVYVSFNNGYKLNPASLQRMFAVLREVPGSVLWLLGAPEGADARLRAAAEAAGVAPARLVFMNKLPHADYLARYRHADLFLDTHPYNAHTTASDAIWAGCPVLTVAGETFASRVAASINHHLGLPEMNVADDAAFVETAVRIGRDAAARAALHARLAQCRDASPLYDMRGFARDFAALLRRMAARRREGLAAADLD